MELKPKMTTLVKQKAKSSFQKNKVTLEAGRAWERFCIPTQRVPPSQQ